MKSKKIVCLVCYVVMMSFLSIVCAATHKPSEVSDIKVMEQYSDNVDCKAARAITINDGLAIEAYVKANENLCSVEIRVGKAPTQPTTDKYPVSSFSYRLGDSSAIGKPGGIFSISLASLGTFSVGDTKYYRFVMNATQKINGETAINHYEIESYYGVISVNDSSDPRISLSNPTRLSKDSNLYNGQQSTVARLEKDGQYYHITNVSPGVMTLVTPDGGDIVDAMAFTSGMFKATIDETDFRDKPNPIVWSAKCSSVPLSVTDGKSFDTKSNMGYSSSGVTLSHFGNGNTDDNADETLLASYYAKDYSGTFPYLAEISYYKYDDCINGGYILTGPRYPANPQKLDSLDTSGQLYPAAFYYDQCDGYIVLLSYIYKGDYRIAEYVSANTDNNQHLLPLQYVGTNSEICDGGANQECPIVINWFKDGYKTNMFYTFFSSPGNVFSMVTGYW